MNRRAMMKPILAAILLSLMLVGCAPGESAQLTGTDLKGAAIGGSFTLTDKDGKTVRWEDFDGRYRIVYFGFTFCPDACPTDMRSLMQGFARFEKEHPERAAKVQPIFITIDPARDTPKQVGEFAAAFHPRLIGLTGSQAEVDRAAKAFKAYYARGADMPGGYNMDHSRIAYLMDPAGRPIEGLPVEQSPDAVAADLAIAVQ
jgi:protein SCO1/2